MAVPFFYEPLLITGATSFTLSEETSKHCVQVLRMEQDSRLDITNGKGTIFEASIQTPHKKNTLVTIHQQRQEIRANQKITLGISLLKNAVRLEWLFEKATEMGIYRIAPLLCERTIHERFKTERMQHILQSAMIQSQQAWLPTLDAPISFNDFISKNTATQQLIAHCEPAEKTSIKAIQPSEDCILLIGPEGDFTIPEIKMATEHHYIPLHLGPTRLRTETAGIFALSVLKIF